MGFKKAERSQIKLKLALDGPSGSGKTFTSLLLAAGFIESGEQIGNGRIAVIDSENETSAVYSEFFDFDILPLKPPFTVKSYLEAINEAVKAGYEILVIDSISHEWNGKGGLLEQKEMLDSSGKGNSYTNWGTITKQHTAFMEAIVQAPIHIIATMRSKQDYILVEGQGASGKAVSKPQKVGLAPIQREGTEYEFYTVLSLSMNHMASCSKDRTGLFDGREGFIPNKETGAEMKAFLKKGILHKNPATPDFPAEQTGKAAEYIPKDETEIGGAPGPLDQWKDAIGSCASIKELDKLVVEAKATLGEAEFQYLETNFNKKRAQLEPKSPTGNDPLSQLKACKTHQELWKVYKAIEENRKTLEIKRYFENRLTELQKGAAHA